MNEHQKAKHAYSVHQDSLLWSRIQVLIAIQTGTLVGTFFLGKGAETTYSALLSALGVVLTMALWVIAERDQLHREKSRADSKVESTEIHPEFPLNISGGDIIRTVIVLLIFADVITFVLPIAPPHVLASIVPVAVIVLCMIGFWVRGVAMRELDRIRAAGK